MFYPVKVTKKNGSKEVISSEELSKRHWKEGKMGVGVYSPNASIDVSEGLNSYYPRKVAYNRKMPVIVLL